MNISLNFQTREQGDDDEWVPGPRSMSGVGALDGVVPAVVTLVFARSKTE